MPNKDNSKKIKLEKKMNKKYNLTVVETFVGCGGSHIGFDRENFDTVFVNDIWDTALKTLKQNNPKLNDEQVICEDINTLCEKDLLKQYNMKPKELDVLIGGVVCKGFSLAGVRNPYDDRNYLYISQLKLVEQFRPKISIIENVPGMKNMKILCKNNYAPVSNKLRFNISESIENICKQMDEIIDKHKKNRGAIIAVNKKLSENETDELIKLKETLLEEKTLLELSRKELDTFDSESEFDALKKVLVGWNDVAEEDGTPILFNDKNLKEFAEDIDFVNGVLEAFKKFYANAQSGN